MTTIPDTAPDHSNKFAFIIGRIFHPFLVVIPTIFVVLSDLTLGEALKWSFLVLGIVLTPGILINTYIGLRHKKYVYQREIRGPLYLIGFLSGLACLIVLIVLGAPRILIAGLTVLIVWLPAQMLINQYVTKISAHASVIAGCLTGLLLIGKLNHPVVLALVILVAVITMWSRVETKNHTVPQVVMGFLVGALPVLIVFPLMLS